MRFIVPIFVAMTFFAACGTDDPGETQNNNTNNNNATCERGTRRCANTQTVLTCVDGTRETASQCLDTEACVSGECQTRTVNCDNTCERPATRCNAAGNLETCNDHNNDGCDEFGGAMACEDGFFCNAVDGLCAAAACQDECTEGEKSCEDDLLTTCFRAPNGCLTFGVGEECETGQVCMNGACETTTECTNECTAGEGTCTADGQVRMCETDGNGCMVLSAPTDCAPNSVCTNGACVAVPTCTDQCVDGEQVCFVNDLATCERQANGCLEFTNPPMTCPGEQTCQNNNGTVMCAAPPITGPVVINEIFYDATGPDVRGSGASEESPIFIELFGPAGLDISGYQIELVDGAGGMVYGTYTLPANSALDGNGFAVLVSDKPDTFLSLALPFFANVYAILTVTGGQDAIQNGADNVILKDDAGMVEDAVAYGYTTNFNFMGEGMCPDEMNCQNAPDAASGRSIGRTAGVDTDNNKADFKTFYPTPGLANADLKINEVYFNQPGTDTGSETFVEVVAPITGWEDMSLNGYVLRAINGFNGDDYLFSGAIPGIEFSGTMLNDSQSEDGYVVVCNIDDANATLLDVCSVPFEGVDFQNGPDNFVLTFDGEVIDAIGYGTFSGTNVFQGEGTAKPYAPANAGKSLGRWPLDDPSQTFDSNDNNADFHLMDPNPGRANPTPVVP